MNIKNAKIKKEFDALFLEWQKVIQSPKIQVCSRSQDYINNEPYRRIVKMGTPALPLVIEKLKQGIFLLNQAVFEITGKKEEVLFGRGKKNLSEQEKSRYLVDWWNSLQ